MSSVDVSQVLYFDIETHSSDLMYAMPPEEFVRTFQYAWGRDGEVQITTDLEEARSLIRFAERVVGHNIISFDLPAVFGADSLEPLHMAYQKKIVDTFVVANMLNPPPYSYTNRAGHTYYDAAKPELAMKWLSLDNQAFQLGVPGKIHDLKELAKKHGGFGEIPLDDPEFIEYAIQDVETTRQVALALLELGEFTPYIWREHFLFAVNARISQNGFKVDIPTAEDRVEELRVRREELMKVMVEKYGLPAEGKSPWATTKGKEAIMSALADYGITPETHPDWEKTATGNISLGGKELMRLTEGTEAEELGVALAELKGQRSLAQLALDSVHADGYAHPSILALQRSGRSSVLNPGLTIWTARGPGAIEKRYFVADPGCKLVAYDFSNADQRVVAALSGDKKYLERFEEGKDGHEINGRLAFGDEVYDSDPAHYRNLAKPLGHGWGYRGGPKALAKAGKVEEEVARNFIDALNAEYAGVVRWQDKVTQEGESGWVTNDWGRRMMIDFYDDPRWGRRSRSYTQSSGLLGQSGTSEIMRDALIRIYQHNPEWLRWIKVPVHDELIWSIPEDVLESAVPKIAELMSTKWKPKEGGQLVDFPVSFGEPGDNWFEATH